MNISDINGKYVRIKKPFHEEFCLNPGGLAQISSIKNDSSFGEEEGGVITVSTHRRGDRFWITVSDNGPGVPEDTRGQIFDPLYSTKTYGVGLGLPLVKQVVEDHHGVISLVDSEEGGAAFRIDIPVKQPKPGGIAA